MVVVEGEEEEEDAVAACRHATVAVAVAHVCVGRNEGEDEEGLKE